MRAWMTRLALVYCVSASVRAADLYPPAAPDEAGSAMVSGQAILNRLQTGTNEPLRSGAFTEPVAGPTVGTMPTLNEIMAAAPATNAAAAAPGEVLAGKTYWGLVESAWGTQTGTMTNQAARGFMPSPANVTIPAGYYSGSGVVTGDVDLVTANIRAGANVFGVTGTPAVVNTASGTATAGNMLTGNTAYVNGSLVTGTMATRTLSAANATVSAGYYAATTLTAVDTDLAAANIRAGVNLFGVTGNSAVVNTASGTAVAGDILAGDTAYVNGAAITGTMANQAARGFIPGAANVTIPAGYYSGSGVVTGDANLVTANIRAGANVFGVTGTPAVVNTASGTATAGNVLTGNTAYVNGSLVTGTMATRTLSAANATVSAGYYAATTLTAVDTDLAAENIRYSTVVFGQTGTLRPALGDATAAQVLTGQTFTTNNSAELTGTMANQAARGFIPGAANVTIPAGYYSGSGVVTGDANLVTANIRAGANVFGVTGTPAVVNTASGTAVAGDILAGDTAYVNGAAITGTMANQAARGFIPGAANVTIPAGYYSGSGVVTGDVDLVTANIRAGANVFGVTGTPAVVNTASGTAVAGDILAGDTAYVNGAQITGTMATRTLSAANATVSAGYYAATTLTAVDADLTAANLPVGVTVFGVTGTVYAGSVPKTGQTTSYQAGDDGTYAKGVAWPSPRFTVQANTNCVLDNFTGLIWARNANLYGGAMTWSAAITYCEGLSYGDQTDWRLPNVKELMSLFDYSTAVPSIPVGHPFHNFVFAGKIYGSSTTMAGSTTYAATADMQSAKISNLLKTSAGFYVWPVRGGQ